MLALGLISARDLGSVWRRNFDVYVRLWKTELFTSVSEPVATVIGLGWGVGSLVAGKLMNVPYLTYVGAGLLAFTALMRAMFECTYGSYFRMVYQSTFDAILATPVDTESLAAGEIAWGATKAVIEGIPVIAVLAAFGALLSPYVVLVPIIVALGSLWVAALSLLITSRIRDINHYNFYLGTFFSYLWISGAYYPLNQLNIVVQMVSWVVPITSAIALCRGLMIGNLTGLHALQMIYLIVSTLVMAEFAIRSFRRRLAT